VFSIRYAIRRWRHRPGLAITATLAPVWRATRIDPAVTLHED
jgi:hypothetical protein